jgi:tetratricopeptide (TPR) repeat protein
MKLINLAKSASWALLALLSAPSALYAQETGQNAGPLLNASDSYESILRDAEALVKSGKPVKAYILLEPLEFEHAGEVRFDYLIGIAALDSGKPDKATLAFERVLAVSPDFTAARLDMARAYYQLGDFPRARTEFAAVLRQNPSEAVRASIQKYLDEIDALQEGKRARITAYAEGMAGRDSNVNYSTSQQQVFVDRFATTATIDPANVQVADSYFLSAAGSKIEYGLNAKWGLYAGADVRKRNNNTQAQFDALNLDAHAGVTYETRVDRVRVGILGGQYDLGGARNSDTTGLKAEWHHALSPANQLDVFVQQVKYRFADVVMQPNDFDQQAVGFGWMHVLANGKTTLSGSAHYGLERDVSPIVTVASPGGGRNDGAKHFHGLRLGGQLAFGERTTLFASTGMQVGAFDKVNYYFQRQRSDRLIDLAMGASWHWDKLWTLRPQLNYSRNESNIAIYDYNRIDVSLTVRRNFR